MIEDRDGTAPLGIAGDLPGYERCWTIPIKHFQGKARGFVRDTMVSFWRPTSGSSPWIVEKQLLEAVDGCFPPAALSIAEEKANIAELTRRGAPCAQLAQVGADDPYKVRTWYAGPMIPEILRHSLPNADYAAVFHAVLTCIEGFARVGCLLPDGVPRNFNMELTGIRHGHLRFGATKGIDHAKSLMRGGAGSRPWPSIGLLPGSAPEFVRLLRADVDRPLNEQVPGCPFASFDELRRQPESVQAHWASQLTSPALGSAIDDGTLDIAAAMQSIFAVALRDALGRQQSLAADLLPSERWHPDALAFVAGCRPIIDRMCSLEPADRYPSLHDAALAFGPEPPELSIGTLTLLTPGSDPVEGGSQPDGLFPASTPQRLFDGLTEEGPHPDSHSDAPVRWPLTRPMPSRRALAVVGALALVFGAGGLVPAATSESVEAHQARQRLRALQLQWRRSRDRKALRAMVELAHGGAPKGAAGLAQAFLDQQWQAVLRDLAAAIADDRPSTVVDPLKVRIREWSEDGYAPATAWLQDTRPPA